MSENARALFAASVSGENPGYGSTSGKSQCYGVQGVKLTVRRERVNIWNAKSKTDCTSGQSLYGMQRVKLNVRRERVNVSKTYSTTGKCQYMECKE